MPLHNGDVLAVRQIPQWNDLGASVTVRGEVQHPATYGIEPGERLSSVLLRCSGFTAEAYPYGAVLIRREVRELEMRSHLELVNRIKAEEDLFEGSARRRYEIRRTRSSPRSPRPKRHSTSCRPPLPSAES